MKALDLFCGAGGASMGLHRAGFEVTGVDIDPHPDYPFAFRLGNALEQDLRGFDLIWASPPCQGFTAYKRRPGHVRPRDNLIPAVRDMLRASGAAYIIENVEGAPLENPIKLCGSMFGLDVRRHRLFETSFSVAPPRLPAQATDSALPAGDKSKEPAQHRGSGRVANPLGRPTKGHGDRLDATCGTDRGHSSRLQRVSGPCIHGGALK